jgi:hypothetical protein
MAACCGNESRAGKSRFAPWSGRKNPTTDSAEGKPSVIPDFPPDSVELPMRGNP